MSKKYIGKLKSFKELMDLADEVDDEGDLLFYKSIDTGIYFENSKKELCGTEILLLKSENVNFDYINSNQKQYYKKEWFSEIKEIEENEVWRPENKYFTTDNTGYIIEYRNIKSETNLGQISSYNAWKTQEEAETVEKSMKLYRAMMRFKFDNDNIPSSDNFEYIIDFERARAVPIVWNNPAIVSFSSYKKAEDCIEFLIKEGLIEKHFIVGNFR